MNSVPLGLLVAPVESWNPIVNGRDESIRYIDIAAVDNTSKRIVASQRLLGRQAPSRARQLVNASDVLVSTVRPNLNAVATVESDLDGATASTGFCVLRARPAKLNHRYLFQWVKSAAFVAEMVQRATGASYPAVSDRIILDAKIPLPSLPEQRRIADILDRAETLRAQRRQALAQLDALAEAIFLEMFGNPLTNPKAWPTTKLSSLGRLDRGVSKHRPRNDPVLLGGIHPLIQTGDISNCDRYVRSFSATYSEIGLQQSRKWPAGTLCITIAANIAKTGVLTFDACFPDSVVGFQPNDQATTEFIQTWLSFLQKMLEDSAPESAQKNINLAILRDLEVPLPPMAKQRVYVARLVSIEQMKTAHHESSRELDALFASIQHRAFRGEL